ncbi:hypothetical protein HMPREF1199_00557 [Hoylesella oralis CC98A]|nr:hypothetical protein HMPREF1199_00557 [Hoylesella oralis CC98A]
MVFGYHLFFALQYLVKWAFVAFYMPPRWL